MKALFISYLLLAVTAVTTLAQKQSSEPTTPVVQQFVHSLNPEQRQLAVLAFDDQERYNWYYVPRDRKGLPLKKMTPEQRTAAMQALQTLLSTTGYQKITAIIDLENVLRVVENRPPNDTYRDPENYYFTVFGDPDQAKMPWSFRIDGHHVALQFSMLNGKLIGFTPAFMGSNPGVVRAEVPQKGTFILQQEADLAYKLLNGLTEEQLKKAVISDKCPGDIVTTNTRKASIDKKEGIAYGELTTAQQKLFLELLTTYLDNYHVTLKNQQLDKLRKSGLDQLVFAWAGDREPGYGPGKGQYYRIHGPTILIEFDNSQNQANHIHSVVRDLTNDFGEDMLRLHYEQQHK
ncbi:DUF3500 domain-containing protein [Arsenicibacter rosenii]|uniref:DUF3500 domain-containing protein n=1 Tax=Arsenicibacter rosenii TaxID=1750698 RepID=A0A1S2VJM2_9BACT|nr:DUF3500 domain-containing protein [Arsenicibacter rosenii]OIN58977.1 hypothetical protein BLX24_12225 [Arsenicibacter rosenii]